MTNRDDRKIPNGSFAAWWRLLLGCFVLLWWISGYPFILFAVETKQSEIDMRAGEQEILPFFTTNSLHVSRRGIVEVQYLNDNRWRVTALRKGIVMIMEKDNAGEIKRSVLVHVASSDEPKRAHDQGLFAREELNAFFCGEKGVICDEGRKLLKGESSSWHWYRQARETCRRNAPCVFAVTLSEQASRQLKDSFQALLSPWFRMESVKNGVGVALADCPDDNKDELTALANHLTEGAVDRGELMVLCAGKFLARGFFLKAKVFVLSSDEAERFGLDLGETLSASSPAVLEKIFAFLKHNKARLIAEPFLKLYSGVEGTLSSGSELRIEAETVRKKEYWKKIGLAMTVKGFITGKDTLRVHYKIVLSNLHPSGDDRIIQNSSASSLVDLAFAHPEIIGGMEAQSTHHGEQGIPYLRAVPIIGPLLRGIADGGDRNRLYIWLEASEDRPFKDREPH